MTNLKLTQKFYASNNIQVEHQYYADDLGIRNGLFTTFYENGQVKSMVAVINNRLSGLYESFYEDGKLKYRCTYDCDKWVKAEGRAPEKCKNEINYEYRIRVMYEYLEFNTLPLVRGF